MKTSTKIITAAAAALALGAGGMVFAQAGQGPHGRMGGGMGMQQAGMGMNGGGHGSEHGGKHGAGAMGDPTARLATVKTELKITAEQEATWQAFEGVVREQAASRQAMRTAMQARMQDPAAAASVDHAAQREAMLKLREARQAALDTARQALVAELTLEQKALADQLLLNGAGSGHSAHKHRHAG